MKAISVRQPWAALIAAGIKRVEWRSWPTTHVGPLLIVASKTFDALRMMEYGAVQGAKKCGVAVAVVTVTHIENCEGEYAWHLADPKPIEPFPVKGRLGLFDVDLPEELASLEQRGAGDACSRSPHLFRPKKSSRKI